MSINNIRIEVTTEYLPEKSLPVNSRYVFAYHVNIHNEGNQSAQLIARHWVMTDGDDKTQEIKGIGVIGVQPNIGPGDSYQYTSGAVIETVVGTMHGSYQMKAVDGTVFEVTISPFSFAVPNQVH